MSDKSETPEPKIDIHALAQKVEDLDRRVAALEPDPEAMREIVEAALEDAIKRAA